MYIPTIIKKNYVRFGVNSNWTGQIASTFHGATNICSDTQTISSFFYIEDVTMDACEKILGLVKEKIQGFGCDR